MRRPAVDRRDGRPLMCTIRSRRGSVKAPDSGATSRRQGPHFGSYSRCAGAPDSGVISRSAGPIRERERRRDGVTDANAIGPRRSADQHDREGTAFAWSMESQSRLIRRSERPAREPGMVRFCRGVRVLSGVAVEAERAGATVGRPRQGAAPDLRHRRRGPCGHRLRAPPIRAMDATNPIC